MFWDEENLELLFGFIVSGMVNYVQMLELYYIRDNTELYQ